MRLTLCVLALSVVCGAQTKHKTINLVGDEVSCEIPKDAPKGAYCVPCKDKNNKNCWAAATWGNDPKEVELDAAQFRSVPKPEPMDVPAVSKEVETVCHTPDLCELCYGDKCKQIRCECPKETIWSCKDKSRILLTDEQGGRHCVKFPK